MTAIVSAGWRGVELLVAIWEFLVRFGRKARKVSRLVSRAARRPALLFAPHTGGHTATAVYARLGDTQQFAAVPPLDRRVSV